MQLTKCCSALRQHCTHWGNTVQWYQYANVPYVTSPSPCQTLCCVLCQVILEEFGKYINLTTGADMAQRNQYYSIIFDEINRLTDAGKPIKVCATLWATLP